MIKMINQPFIILAATSIWHALNALNTGSYTFAGDFSPDKEAGSRSHGKVFERV
jgi:hypothetical protein